MMCKHTSHCYQLHPLEFTESCTGVNLTQWKFVNWKALFNFLSQNLLSGLLWLNCLVLAWFAYFYTWYYFKRYSKKKELFKALHYKAGIYIQDSYIPSVIMGLVYTASTEMQVHQFCTLFNPKAVQKLLSNPESHCSDKDYSNMCKTTCMWWNLLFLVS